MTKAVIAIGSNRAGTWGPPARALTKTIYMLREQGIIVDRCSRAFSTRPVNMPMQPNVLNAVLAIKTGLPPATLLRLLKVIERRAGRSCVIMSRARPLDLDLVAYGGRVIGWPLPASDRGRRQYGRLIVPHPFMHLRPFVLVPMAEVAPRWVHPVFGQTTLEMLKRLPLADRRLRASPGRLLPGQAEAIA